MNPWYHAMNIEDVYDRFHPDEEYQALGPDATAVSYRGGDLGPIDDPDDVDEEYERYDACVVCNALCKDPSCCERCQRSLCFVCADTGSLFCHLEDCGDSASVHANSDSKEG